MSKSLQQVKQGHTVKIEIPLVARMRGFLSGHGVGPTLGVVVNDEGEETCDVMTESGDVYMVPRKHLRKLEKNVEPT